MIYLLIVCYCGGLAFVGCWKGEKVKERGSWKGPEPINPQSWGSFRANKWRGCVGAPSRGFPCFPAIGPFVKLYHIRTTGIVRPSLAKSKGENVQFLGSTFSSSCVP